MSRQASRNADTRALKRAARAMGVPLRVFARAVLDDPKRPRLAAAARSWLDRKAAR